jgi:SOS-response transcriptional repressor LexA
METTMIWVGTGSPRVPHSRDEWVVIPRRLPFLGTVMASVPRPGAPRAWPSPAEDALGDTLSFDEWLLPRRETCVLVRVNTDAMAGAGILPGDLVIVERGRNTRPGDIVLAALDGEHVLRRYDVRSGQPVLVPAHGAYPVLTPHESLRLIGVVSAVVRTYSVP